MSNKFTFNPFTGKLDVVSDLTGFIKADGSVPFTADESMGGHKLTNVTDPVGAQDAATKAYVDAGLAALNPATAVYAATTANIPGTYLNGIAGVGATFTTTATGTFTVDGTTPPLGSRILIKNQSSGFQNGIYNLTTLGSIGVSAIFTRSLDYNTASDMNSAGLIPVVNGTVNALTSWQQVATITTVGTDALVFQAFTANPSLYLLKANNLNDVASSTASFNNISPMTTLGDIIYENATPSAVRLPGNTSATKQFLTQTGNGSISAAPAWSSIVAGDVPTLNQNTTGTASNITASSNSTLTSLPSLVLPTSQLSGTLAAAQFPALTGDVTNTAGSLATTISNSVVTNAKLADMAQSTIKGRAAGSGTGAPVDLTSTQATAILDLFTSTLQGLVPASGGGTTNFLRADGTFAAPSGTGITQLTGDVTAGPGSGSQVATLAASISGAKTFTTSLTSPIFSSSSSNPATAGALRLASTDTIDWRNNANSGNVALGKDTSDQLSFNGTSFLSSSAVLLAAAFPALTGDVTTTAGSLATTIANSAVTNAKLANMAQSTIKGRAAGSGTGAPVDLTATQATAILDVVVGDSGSGGTKGLVPAAGAGDAAAGKFLNAGGTFSFPTTTTDWNIVSKSTTYSAVIGDYVQCDASSAGFTVTLPTAVGVSGKKIAVTKIWTDTTLNQITIATTSSQTINGSTTRKVTTKGETFNVVSDGSNWVVLDHAIPSAVSATAAIGITAVTTNPTKGTMIIDTVTWQRDGNYAIVEWVFEQSTGGTAGSGDYLFALPTGLTADTTILAASTTSDAGVEDRSIQKAWCGHGHQGVSTVERGYVEVFLYDTTHVRFVTTNSFSTIGFIGSGLVTLANGNYGLHTTARIPISTWEPW